MNYPEAKSGSTQKVAVSPRTFKAIIDSTHAFIKSRFARLSTTDCEEVAAEASEEAIFRFDEAHGASLFTYACLIAKRKAMDRDRCRWSRVELREEIFALRHSAEATTGMQDLIRRTWRRELVPDSYYYGNDADSCFFRHLKRLNLDREALCAMLAVATQHNTREENFRFGIEIRCSIRSVIQTLAEYESVNPNLVRMAIEFLNEGKYIQLIASDGLELHPRITSRWERLLHREPSNRMARSHRLASNARDVFGSMNAPTPASRDVRETIDDCETPSTTLARDRSGGQSPLAAALAQFGSR